MANDAYNFSKLTIHSSTIDPDDLVQCPYDPNHQIRKSRLPYHLRDCKRNNPVAMKSKKKVKTCPFNSLHIIPSSEFEHHKTICPDRAMVHSSIMQESVKPSRYDMPIINHNIICSENWDDEITDGTSFFLNGPVSRQNIVNMSGHPESKKQTLLPLRQPRMEPLAQHVELNGQQSQDRVPLRQPISGPPGFGRGVLVQSNEATSSSQKQQRVGNGIKLATSSVGFNLGTLTGRPSFPQVDETSWPDLLQPGQYVTNQQPLVSSTSKLDVKGLGTNRPRDVKTNDQLSVTQERPGSHSAGVQLQSVTTTSQTAVSRQPATSQPPAEKKPSTEAQPNEIISSTIVSQKTMKSQKSHNGTCDNKNSVTKNAVLVETIEQSRLNAVKEEKKLKKKMKAIEQLEAEMAAGKKLDNDQLLKLKGKDEIAKKIALLSLSS